MLVLTEALKNKSGYEMYNHLVKNKRLILSLPLLLAASLFLPSYEVPSAHAQFTGLVCITASQFATSCDGSDPTLGPFRAGSIFSVGVFIQGSDAMGGFDIYVRSDPAYVRPVSASLGNLIANPTLEAMCLNNRTTVNCMGGGANGPGVVEVAAVESSGSNECGGVSPCSGMAFTISYQANVVAPVSSNPISYPTNAGCSTSSVSSPPDTCVLVTDAFGTALPENIQGATVTTEPSGFTGLVCVTYPSTETSCPSTPGMIGPVTMGSTFTVGVFIQGSDAMGGFDIYVRSDPAYARPINASLGNLIADPLLTSICVNGSNQTGDCTVNSANGPGVVEVTTIDANGVNECGGVSPCSGMAFTITYQVAGATSSTTLDYPTHPACSTSSVFSPPNVCVLVADLLGGTLAETIQGATVTQTVTVDPTSTSVSCAPNPVMVFQSTACTATVTDTAVSGATSPTGKVTFSSDGFGTFNPGVPPGTMCVLPCGQCTLSASGTNAAMCSVLYTPSFPGTNNIGASYSGDSSHTPSTAATFALTVTKSTPSLTTVVSSTSVPLGRTISDRAILTVGFPLTGVTGTVTYTLFQNSLCTAGTGTVVSIVTVGPSDNVPASVPVTPAAAGSYSFIAVYSGDDNNNAVTSACEPFTVVPAPSFTAEKLHWTHHLSLAKNPSGQSWTAIVTNPLSTSVNVVIRIVGASTTNPSLTFDVTCGFTCFNTASGGVNFTPGLTPVTVAAGTSSTSLSFNQPIPGGFANQKFSFTATLYWATGTLYTPSNSKSGAFAIVS